MAIHWKTDEAIEEETRTAVEKKLLSVLEEEGEIIEKLDAAFEVARELAEQIIKLKKDVQRYEIRVWQNAR